MYGETNDRQGQKSKVCAGSFLSAISSPLIRQLSLPGMGSGGRVGNLHMEYLWSIFQADREMAESSSCVYFFSVAFGSK